MAFGQRFENIRDRVTSPGDPTNVRAAFDAALGALRGAGGTLYVPPLAEGRLRVDVAGGAIVIPSNVELRVAPGVTLLPVARHEGERSPAWAEHGIEIRGAFCAPIGPVFASRSRFQLLAPGSARQFDLGAVRFSGRTLERVHPEWWGVGDAGDDSEALDEAVRAAVYDRWEDDGRGGRRWLRPVPIELLGGYVLSRPWVLLASARPDGAGGIELRGAPGGDDTPTLRCGETFDRSLAMVTAALFESVTFDEVRFDAGDARAAVCLRITAQVDDARPSRGTYLRRCSFRGASDALVSVLTSPLVPTGDPALAGLERQTFEAEGCQFYPSARDRTPRALVAQAPPSTDVEVRGCLFKGAALAMIHASSCSVSVTSSQFENTLTPGGAQFRDIRDLHARGPEGGVDIFLDAVPQGAPATLYAQDCRSISRQFLATCRDAPPDTGRDSTIVSLHHVRPEVGTLPLFGFINRRPPPALDVIIPDPVVTQKSAPIEKIMAVPTVGNADARDVPDPKSPLVAGKDLPTSRFVAATTHPSTIDPAAATVGLSVLPPPGPIAHEWIAVVPEDLLPAAIDWRIRTETGARLTLIGCRFDWLDSLGRPPVNAYAGASITDLGAFNGRVDSAELIHADSPTLLVTVPRLSEL